MSNARDQFAEEILHIRLSGGKRTEIAKVLTDTPSDKKMRSPAILNDGEKKHASDRWAEERKKGKEEECMLPGILRILWQNYADQ